MTERVIPATVPSVRTDRVDGRGHGQELGLCRIWSPRSELVPALVRLGEGALGMGRSADNALPLEHDHAVSRYHARIERRGEQVFVVDQGSTNGTWVNGERVREAPLHDHDVLRIGDSLFRVATTELDVLARSDEDRGPSRIVGGARMAALSSELRRVAGTDLSVLVRGESGTGKEVVARELHAHSGRRGKLVAVNCAALPASLIESELFGYRKGAFSGAVTDKPGLVRAAHGGTLFLDEIGDMPLEAQAKLLRVLQEREVRPVGGTEPEPVDLRVVSATHRDLRAFVAEGKFRGDLLARLCQFELTLPALRERREDLLPLVRHFLDEYRRTELTITVDFMDALACYPFPYNIRELASAVKVATTLATGSELCAQHLPETLRKPVPSPATRPAAPNALASDETLRLPKKPPTPAPTAEQLAEIMRKHQGNISAVSRELGKDRVQIHRWLKRYALDPEKLRE